MQRFYRSTLWFGPLDNIDRIEYNGLNIQGGAGAEVCSVGSGRVSHVDNDAYYGNVAYELGSPGYMHALSNFMDTDLAGMSPLYGSDAVLQLVNAHAINKMMADVNAYGSTDTISDAYWRVFCLKFNSCVQGYGSVWKKDACCQGNNFDLFMI